MFLAALSRMKTSTLFKGKGKIPKGSESKIIDLWTSDPVGTCALKSMNESSSSTSVEFYDDHKILLQT